VHPPPRYRPNPFSDRRPGPPGPKRRLRIMEMLKKQQREEAEFLEPSAAGPGEAPLERRGGGGSSGTNATLVRSQAMASDAFCGEWVFYNPELKHPHCGEQFQEPCK